MSSVSFSCSFSCTSRKMVPSVSFISRAFACLVNFTLVCSSRETILVESRPTDAELSVPVCRESPLLKRMFSMTRPDSPDASSISTDPS